MNWKDKIELPTEEQHKKFLQNLDRNTQTQKSKIMNIKKKQEEILNYVLGEILAGNAEYKGEQTGGFVYFKVQNYEYWISEYTIALYGSGSSLKLTEEQKTKVLEVIATGEAELKADKIAELKKQIKTLENE